MKELVVKFIEEFFSFDQANPLLFTQLSFWVFFIAVFGVFSILRNRCLLRNAFLFFASLFFYFKTSGLFLILLVAVVVVNYLSALALGTIKKKSFFRALILTVTIVADLSCLCYYKYAYFFTDIVNNLLGTHFVPGGGESIILPVGISFFTFQAISYVVDVYRRTIPAVKNFLDFGFYLTFFPQLVAGPIVRATDFVPQLHRPYFLSRRWFGIAVFWIINGLAKKFILSDYMAASFNDMVFANPSLFTGFENLTVMFTYALQIYGDFSGYTDIAIGIALLMGFHLPANFNSPYKSRTPIEFWRRWHISLSSWLKDYLYIPLGGNRKVSFASTLVVAAFTAMICLLLGTWYPAAIVGVLLIALGVWAWCSPKSRKIAFASVNRMNTMLLGGLWHGASWNFVLWGGLNGAAMVLCQIWQNTNIYLRTIAAGLVTAVLWYLHSGSESPVLNLLFWWMAAIALGAVISAIWSLATGRKESGWIGRSWAVAQTFFFMAFAFLFFRAGSNLDPADANQTAWDTATAMISQIGGPWNIRVIPQIIAQYKSIYMVFAVGMIIHWLPARFKRRYRLWFAGLPLLLMILVVVLAFAIMYQFVTADMQTFIYFQF